MSDIKGFKIYKGKRGFYLVEYDGEFYPTISQKDGNAAIRMALHLMDGVEYCAYTPEDFKRLPSKRPENLELLTGVQLGGMI